MPMKNPLIYLAKEKNPKVRQEDRELISRFTEAGIDALVDYYNQKYPERGLMHRASSWFTDNIGFKENATQKGARSIVDHATTATISIEDLREEKGSPLKIVFTLFQKDKLESDLSKEKGVHTFPLLLTSDKLILLRDDYSMVYEVFEKVAENLGVEFVRPILKSEGIEGSKKTSIQSDEENCNGIAVGILKYLTASDVEEVSKFKSGYTPLPQMLKYSQSRTHIQEHYPELLNSPVKKDGTTLGEYVDKNSTFKTTEDGEEQKVGNRIDDKMLRIKAAMSSLGEKEAGEKDERSRGSRVLDKLKSEKEDKERS